jgi:hypothetical protein
MQIWMERFFLETVHLLPACKALELFALLHSLGVGGVQPPQQWLHAWATSTLPHLQQGLRPKVCVCVCVWLAG